MVSRATSCRGVSVKENTKLLRVCIHFVRLWIVFVRFCLRCKNTVTVAQQRGRNKTCLIPPLVPEHVRSSLFPELNASLFDPVSSRRLTRTGQRMRALGLDPPRGRSLDLKERSEREPPNPESSRGEEADCLSGAYQAEEVIYTVRPLKIDIISEEARGRGD